MVGIAKASGLDVGKVVLMNVFYEIFTVCTSIVVEDPQGGIMHARNLDFGLFMGYNFSNRSWELTTMLRPLLVNVNYTSGGQEVFQATHYVGYVGVLTGMKKGAFSVTIDDRFAGEGGYVGILKWILGDHKENWVSLLARDALQGQDFNGALNLLQQAPIIAPVYYILAGVNSGEGAVISRSLTKSYNLRTLQPNNASNPNGWWVLETNYDWWEKAPFYDQRREAAVKCVTEMGRNDISPGSLFDILSTKPVLNQLTTYSVLMSPQTGFYESYLQYCPGWCPLW